MAGKIPRRVRREVAKRARNCCEYCGSQAQFSHTTFSIEHIIPRVRGGSDDLSNLALACQGCNNLKHTLIDFVDPQSGQRVPLFHPRKDRWDDHYRWDDSFTMLVGLSPIGRATIAALKLNRPGLQQSRGVLHALGRHPL